MDLWPNERIALVEDGRGSYIANYLSTQELLVYYRQATNVSERTHYQLSLIELVFIPVMKISEGLDLICLPAKSP